MQNNCRNAFPNKFNASQTMRDLSKIGESPRHESSIIYFSPSRDESDK